MEIFRAANCNYSGKGSCWACDLESAKAYTDNGMFGGEDLYSAEIDPDGMLDWTGVNYSNFEHSRDVRDALLHIIKLGKKDEDVAETVVRICGYSDPDLVNYIEIDEFQQKFFDRFLGGFNIHDIFDRKEMVDLFGKIWESVSYRDSYPDNCETVVALRDGAIFNMKKIEKGE